MPKRPQEPAAPGLTNLNSPSGFCQLSRVHHLHLRNSTRRERMRCCRRKGNSRVFFKALMSQPSVSLRGLRGASPNPSFLSEMGSVVPGKSSGDLRTSSIAFIKMRLTTFLRWGLPCMARMKSSTKMSALASGFGNGLLEATCSGAGSAEKGRSPSSQEVGARCVAGGLVGGKATLAGAERCDTLADCGSDT